MKLSMVSSVNTHITHSSMLTKHIAGFKKLQFDFSKFKQFRDILHLRPLDGKLSPIDVAFVLVPLLCIKPVLNWFDVAKKDKVGHQCSLVGYLEKPLIALTQFPLFLFFLDVLSISIHALGIDFHIKGGLPDLVLKVSYCILGGAFLTRIKDWFVQQVWRKEFPREKRDFVREETVDEITSVLIWFIMGVIGLEFMSLRMGFALGSLFAVGGLGSASFVLAMRSTMENAIGGLLLKLQDKFRVGDVITLPGKDKEDCTVEELTYISTKLRKADNSLLVVPNHIFTQGEVVNWSRTPFRLFRTSVTIPATDLKQLAVIVNKIRSSLMSLDTIEKNERDIIVAATGFKENKVIVEVETHICSTNEVQCGEIKTEIVSRINSCLAGDNTK